MTTIANAIARSISHNEIVVVDLGSLLSADQRAEMQTAANEWDRQSYSDHRRAVAEEVVSDAQSDHDDADSVHVMGDEDYVDVWGTVDGSDYRVHVRL